MDTTLRALRQARGLSQEALADALGVDRRTVWRWENAKVAIPYPMLYKLAALFHVAPRDIAPERIAHLIDRLLRVPETPAPFVLAIPEETAAHGD